MNKNIVGRQFMDVSKYVMFSDGFVHVDEVVLGHCSKSPLNTSIPGEFRPKECETIAYTTQLAKKLRFFVPTVWYMAICLLDTESSVRRNANAM